MRVLIIAANQEQKPDPVVPLGAAYVAGAARRAGHETRMFDACFLGDEAADRLAAELRDFQPEVVGLSLRNIDDVAWPRAHSYLPHYRRLAQTVRAEAPESCLVLGGSAFTLMPELFLADLAADYGIAGEGEQAFPELLQRLDEGVLPARPRELGRRVFRAAVEALSQTEPALDLLDLATYYARGGALNVQTRRGCAFSCSYCTYPLLEGQRSRLRDPAVVVDGIARVLQQVGARHFFVVDNTFNLPLPHAHAFCAELRSRNLGVHWTAYISPAGLTAELLQDMASAGCTSVEFGTDAAAPATLKGLGKSFGAKEIVNASSWAREAGLRFAHSLILGGPGETMQTLQETVSLIDSTRPTAVFGMLGVRLYPNTPMAKLAEHEGFLRRDAIGIEPMFYISEAVRDELEEFAARKKAESPHWYFPGLEGERWVRFWRRRRAHGARGPLWEFMGEEAGAAQSAGGGTHGGRKD
ncbi:MAG: cobalamin-dependent protein [Planctomycetes bacterium]|nr:cobalamin-dependent protein [Planctomycetota bacterium]